jgi:hypothetical protein
MTDVSGGGAVAGAWPDCKTCGKGTLLPLSDYGRDGATITYKAWVCSNPDCGFTVRCDNGAITYGRSPATPS